MEDISKILASLSSDDIDMLKGVADSILGGGGEEKDIKAKKAEQQQPSSPLGDLGGFNIGPNELSMIMKVKSAFEKLNQNGAGNDSTQLILALKPHLSEKRQARADQALQLMKMMDMMPLLREIF